MRNIRELSASVRRLWRGSETSRPPAPVGGWLILGAVAATLAAGYAWAAGAFTDRLTPDRIIDRQQGAEPHAGFRRAHAKGLCISGYFRSSGALAPLSRSAIFASGRDTPFVGRFSIGGNNPTAPDLKAGVRSLALDFRLADGERWRTAMNTPPVLAVRTPEDFFAQIGAARPDPATGKPDPARVAAFNAAHPEGAEFYTWQKIYKPSGSWASERYHSINAFELVDAGGVRRPVRWRAEPIAGWEPVGQGPGDALQQELLGRLRQGPVRFQLIFTLAGQGDRADDPSRSWPANRKQVSAGTLVIEAAHLQRGGACDGLNFDPLVLPDGIAPSDDPILHARGGAYAESYRRRAQEIVTGAGR